MELAEIVADFKARAASFETPNRMLAREEFLILVAAHSIGNTTTGNLQLVVAALLHTGRIREDRLQRFPEEKRSCIRRIGMP